MHLIRSEDDEQAFGLTAYQAFCLAIVGLAGALCLFFAL